MRADKADEIRKEPAYRLLQRVLSVYTGLLGYSKRSLLKESSFLRSTRAVETIVARKSLHRPRPPGYPHKF